MLQLMQQKRFIIRKYIVQEQLESGQRIGLVPQSRKKGIYFDGHERDDVLEYHAKFLEEMKEFEQFMPTFVEDEIVQINPEISSNQQLHIFVIHDECLFYANDDHPIIWAPIEEPPL